MLGWRFPILDGGSEQGFNNSGIATFNGAEMYDNLAREICQNSLDAKIPDKDEPVIVHFKVKDIEINKYPSIIELFQVIKDCKEYWRERADQKLESFFKLASELEQKQSISLLVASDYNTTGLTGVKAEKSEKSKWRALTHSDGVSEKGEDSGGSYGIGKNAPYVCSQLRTVFYNTFAQDQCKAFQGTTRLMSHANADGTATVGTGFYYEISTQKPIEINDNCELRDLFQRQQYGTDVVMIAFEKRDGWQDYIERAIIRNFFIAIHEEKLVVKIDDNRVIDADHLEEIIDKQSKVADDIKLIKELYMARTQNNYPVQYNSFTHEIEHEVELFIRLDESFNRKIAELRNTGMIIRIRGKNVSKAYSAVMIVRGKKLNSILKGMEPPKHDKWDPDIMADESLKKIGRKLRGEVIKWVNDVIDEACKSDATDEIDPDGMSQYLPDELEDGYKTSHNETNALDAKADVQKIIKKSIIETNIKTTGYNEKGNAEEGSVNNTTAGGEGEEETTGAGSGSGNDRVGKTGEGTKIINRPVLLKQRVFQGKQGHYKAAIMVEDDCENAYITINALGEDGQLEPINIIEYEMFGTVQQSNSNKIGPLKLEGGEMEHITLKLEYDEKLRLKVDVQ